MVFIKIPTDMKHLLSKHHLNFLFSNEQKLNTCFDEFGTVQRQKPRLLKHNDDTLNNDIMMKVVLSRISMHILSRKEYIFYIIHLGVFAKERSSTQIRVKTAQPDIHTGISPLLTSGSFQIPDSSIISFAICFEPDLEIYL